jgi:thymidine kinase
MIKSVSGEEISKAGRITLILGSMMSSKSSMLLQYAERAKYAKKKVLIVRPETDTRPYLARTDKNDKSYDYTKQNRLAGANGYLYDLICVDEGQFFDHIGEDAHALAVMGHSVVITALSGDSDMKPWKNISELIPYVDDIIKLNAVCINCGEDSLGTFSFYDGKKESQTVIGDEKSNYLALCRHCYENKKI